MTIFNPVNSELGTIPSRKIKIFKSRILNLSNPSQELNVNKIYKAKNFLLKTKKKKTQQSVTLR